MTESASNRFKMGARQLSCARCGTEFGCNLGGPCWCGEEAAKLPLPATGTISVTGFDECLCRDCLRALSAAHASQTS